MNTQNPQPWTGAEQFNTMDATTDHDFGSLIDFEGATFDNIDLDWPAADAQHMADLAESLDVHNLQGHYPPQIPQNARNGTVGDQQVQHIAPHGMQQHPNRGFFDYGMAQYSQAGTPVFPQAQEQIYRPHQGVPPTPNSVEMHGDPNRYLQQMDPQQALFDQRFHMHKEDASFTPLVSPAVTPHDSRFQIPDFTVPGAYFSPLTSPALNAQTQHHAVHHSQQTTSGSSTGHSPADIDMDILGEPAMGSQEPARKLRSTNKRSSTRTPSGASRVRQSPIVKPNNRRKATVSAIIPPKEVSELVQEARSERPSSSGLDLPSRGTSETDSISPEPMLSEMLPPPKPGSVQASPALMAQQNGSSSTPATPASLMRIQPSPNFDGQNDMPMLDDLTLPEASLDRPSLSRLNTVIYDGEETPRVSSRKTPKLGPLSTPGGGFSNRPSPMLDPMSTPTSPAFPMTNGKKDPKLARNPKKRNSVSSHLVSPALMPKISPSIKPLLPDGNNGSVTSTHALLLASKSNYQNILDGTTVPGVVYPTSLSTNLTSKRTSHKIAEQGRRNRINLALQEMQALLPSPVIGALDAKSPDTGGQQSNNSKAAKVESAIDYIKQLKKEVSDRDDLLTRKDQEMEELRKELAALKRCSSVASTTDSAQEPKTEATSSPNNET